MKTSHFREAVWTLLQDGAWHSILDLIQVGGVRAAARVHELRHEDRRRIVQRTVDGKSAYRYICDCGPVDAPENCDRCRPILRELGIAFEEPAPEEPPKRHINQLFLWGACG